MDPATEGVAGAGDPDVARSDEVAGEVGSEAADEHGVKLGGARDGKDAVGEGTQLGAAGVKVNLLLGGKGHVAAHRNTRDVQRAAGVMNARWQLARRKDDRVQQATFGGVVVVARAGLTGDTAAGAKVGDLGRERRRACGLFDRGRRERVTQSQPEKAVGVLNAAA